MTDFNSHTGKAQNCINKLQNSIEWDLFPFSLPPRLQYSGFICISLFVVSTMHVGFWPDFAPPSGSVKDGPKRRCPRLCCVLLSRQVTQWPRCVVTGGSVAPTKPTIEVAGQGMNPRHWTTWSSRSLKHQSSYLRQERKRPSGAWLGQAFYKSWNFKSKAI